MRSDHIGEPEQGILWKCGLSEMGSTEGDGAKKRSSCLVLWSLPGKGARGEAGRPVPK